MIGKLNSIEIPSANVDIFSQDFSQRGASTKSLQADPKAWLTTAHSGENILFRHEDWKYILTKTSCLRSTLNATSLQSMQFRYPNLYWFYRNSSAEDSQLNTTGSHRGFREYFNSVINGESMKLWFDAIENETEVEINKLASKAGTIDLTHDLACLPLRCAFQSLGLHGNDELLRELQNRLCDYVRCYAIEYNALLSEKEIGLFRERSDSHVAFFRQHLSADFEATFTRLKRPYSEQILANFFAIFAAISSQIINTLCLVLRSLIEHQNILMTLQENEAELERGLLDNAVWELIRFDNAGKGIIRFPVETFMYRGQTFEKNTMIYLAAHLMDHDPNFFETPDEIILSRANANQLPSFGTGQHACMGRWIAHKHVKELIRSMLRCRHRFIHAKTGKWTIEAEQYLSRTLTAAELKLPGKAA